MSRTFVFAMLMCAVVAATDSCGGDTQPNGPSATVQPITGKWIGTYHVVSCNGGFEACHGLKSSYAIKLLLAQSTDQVTGTFRYLATRSA